MCPQCKLAPLALICLVTGQSRRQLPSNPCCHGPCLPLPPASQTFVLPPGSSSPSSSSPIFFSFNSHLFPSPTLASGRQVIEALSLSLSVHLPYMGFVFADAGDLCSACGLSPPHSSCSASCGRFPVPSCQRTVSLSASLIASLDHRAGIWS